MEKIINSKKIKELFAKSSDILVRPIKINQNGLMVSIFCVDGLTDSELFDLAILQSLKIDTNLNEFITERAVMDYLLSGGAYHIFTNEESDYDLLLKNVLSGNAAIIFDGEQKAVVYDVKKFEKRSISEPNEEGVIKGAKDSFIEAMRINTAQIRRRIRSEYLVIESLNVGRVSKTDLALCYISNIANMVTVN